MSFSESNIVIEIDARYTIVSSFFCLLDAFLPKGKTNFVYKAHEAVARSRNHKSSRGRLIELRHFHLDQIQDGGRWLFWKIKLVIFKRIIRFFMYEHRLYFALGLQWLLTHMTGDWTLYFTRESLADQRYNEKERKSIFDNKINSKNSKNILRQIQLI